MIISLQRKIRRAVSARRILQALIAELGLLR